MTKKYYLERHKSTKSIIIIPLLIVLFAVTGYFLFTKNKNANELTDNKQPSQSQVVLPIKVTGRYLFSGTVVIARATSYYAKGDFNQPFSQLESFEPEKYDAWAVDLECPMTTKRQTFQYEVANTVFNCHPEFLPAMSKYFSIYALSNNHTMDLGENSMKETQQHLADGGVQSYGNYDPSIAEDACSVLAIPAHVVLPDSTTEKTTLPIAFCAWHYFERPPADGEMELMKQYAEIMPVWGFSQVGVEYRPNADERQKQVGKTLIDYGADFAIENSPHWVQESEVYKGKPIFYSTGNFIFDQLEQETNRGLSIDVSMEIKYDENVARWIELGKTCQPKALRDDCFAEAKKLGLKKYQPKYVYEPVVSQTGVRVITHKADEATTNSVLQRLNWADTKAKLGQ